MRRRNLLKWQKNSIKTKAGFELSEGGSIRYRMCIVIFIYIVKPANEDKMISPIYKDKLQKKCHNSTVVLSFVLRGSMYTSLHDVGGSFARTSYVMQIY
jgi:hypothetical protein